jgi:enamine deaminase RidA (YjgF/YER057c/UK114 family)
MQMSDAIATVAWRSRSRAAPFREKSSRFSTWQMHRVARAHSERFGAARPASTLVQVSALTAKALVEIEVTAITHDQWTSRLI